MKALMTAALMTAALATPAAAFDPASMTEAERAAFGEAVRDYIMQNPEVLVESLNAMEAKRLANEAENDKLLVAANSAEIFEDSNIKLILKEFPILGQESDLASRYAIAVKQLAGGDSYKSVHDRLYAMRGAVTIESLNAISQELGLDAQAIVQRMNTEEVSAEIRKNRQLAEKMQIMGTPTFVIGPELLRGIPSTGLASAVEQIRAAQG